jgi:xanthine dehydrogenase accessory factor
MALAKARSVHAPQARHGTEAVVLAAGVSSRMGRPKPLVLVGGHRMLARSIESLHAAGISRIVVVLGDHADEVRRGIDLSGVTVVENPAYQEGMSSSLRVGVRATDPGVKNVMIVLSDQPFVAPATLRSLAARSQEEDGSIFVPTYRGVRGNPVVFDRRLAPELDGISGDVGCRGLFPAHAAEIREVPVSDAGILVDIDTEAEWSAIESALDAGEAPAAVIERLAMPRWALHATPAQRPVPKRLARPVSVDAVAEELRGLRVPFALATVVRAVRPTSGRPGYRALVREDGSHVGWVGGACTEHLLVTEAQAALAAGTPRLLRVTPSPRAPARSEEGVVERPMACQSGGTVEIFIEPNIPKPNLVIAGDSPVATSLAALGPLLGFRVVLVAPGADASQLPEVDVLVPDLAGMAEHLTPGAYAVVASMGKYDEAALGAAARAPVAFVGLVASRKRATSVLAALRAEKVPADAIKRIRNPVGIDIGASTPEEIALSILAEITQARRTPPARSPAGPARAAVSPGAGNAIDPVCGMEVPMTSPLTATHDGTRYYFCADACRRKFVRSPAKYLAA